MSKSIVNQTPVVVNDFRAALAELEAEETFEAAYAAAVRCFNELAELTGEADWGFIWETYQKAFGVAAGFNAPRPMTPAEAAIPDEDLFVWQRATWTGINPF